MNSRDLRSWMWAEALSMFDEAEDLLPPRLALVLEWARANIAGH